MVVFDLGGVIVRICRSWPEACARVGLPVRAGWDDAAAKVVRGGLVRTYQDGGMSSEEFFAQVAATAPGLYSAAEVRQVHDAWLIEEYEGVGTLIDDLHSNGVLTGVLSNTNDAHWKRLVPETASLGAGGTFRAPGRVRHPHASHLMGLSKPDPRCYLAFAERVGLKAGEGVIFFDDLLENIEAARGVGWDAIQVDHTGATAVQMRRELEHRGVLG